MVCPAGRAGTVVPSSFGGDAIGAILPTGSTSPGHHCVSVTAEFDRRAWLRRVYVTGRYAQAGEEQRTAGRGDVGFARGRVENYCAVGQLLITPAPEGLHEVVGAIFRNTLLRSVASGSL